MDPVSLLSDEAFARRIAYGLLRDRDAAEELLQDAWVEILERPPRHAGGLRRYLALVLRRLWWKKRASDVSRKAREWLAARGEAQEDTSALVVRAEIHKRTVTAVLALDEPYRTTVLLRFFEDLTPAEISARQGLPVETVRTRLKRAMALLRARLERESDGWRSEWAVALIGAPSLPKSSPRRPVARTALAAGSAALAVVVFSVLQLAERRGRPHAADSAALTGVPNGSSPLAEVSPLADRVRAAPASDAPATPLERAPVLRGRVSAPDGRPLAGAHLLLAIERYHVAPPLACARSDGEGRFEASLAGWEALGADQRGLFRLMLEVWTPGHVPSTRFVAPGDEQSSLEVVLDAGRVLSGRVLDPAGQAVEGARVLSRTRTGEGPVRTVTGLTDLEGWYAIALDDGAAPIDAEVWASRVGFAYLREGASAAATRGDVELGTCTLRPRRELRGRCLHPDGSPAHGVPLRLQRVVAAPDGGLARAAGAEDERPLGRTEDLVLTDELGRFETRVLRPGTYQVRCGFGTGQDGMTWDAGGAPIELTLSRHHLAVEVEGTDGRLLEEARVAVTRLSASGPARTSLRILTGRERPAAVLAVEPGDEFAVLAVVPGCASVEEHVSIAAAPLGTPLRLRLAREERSATLALRPSAGAPDAWTIDLCAPLSGLALPGWQDLAPDPAGRIRGLPRGDYRVRIQPRLARPDELPANCAACADPVVSLTDGETPLAFPVLPAARARVRLSPPRETSGAAPLHAVTDAGADLWSWLGASASAARGTLEVELEGGRPLLRLADLRPRDGEFLDVLVPAAPLSLSLELDGRLHRAELAPAPGETVEIPVSLGEAAPPRPTGQAPR